VLAEVARISGGESLDELTPAAVGERLSELPEPPPQVTRVRLWGHPLFGVMAAALMAALWIGRKAAGRV
jgi:cytochrome c-type biogenesis protein CcmH/NrfF